MHELLMNTSLVILFFFQLKIWEKTQYSYHAFLPITFQMQAEHAQSVPDQNFNH